MRIAMLNLTAGGLSGGYRKYLQRLAPLLASHADVRELLQVVPPGQETLPGLGAPVWSWSGGEQWRGFPQLRERVRAWKPDVVFIPTARHLNCGVPCVSMVRNMEPMMPPTLREGVAPWAKNRVGAYLARTACEQSARVIAVSQFVRDFIVGEWNVDAGRVGVVYHGVDHPAPEEALTASASPALAALRDAPFLFAAGSLLPYRGLEDAIAALALSEVPNVRLAIAGDGSATYRARMEQLANSAGVADRVTWLGFLSAQEMSWAYTHCSAFLMTSRVEACPNTALEAMACGAVIISTQSRPMPEFFRQSALYYSAGDAGALAEQIRAVCSMDRETRDDLQDSARARSENFTWQDTANGTITELSAAIARVRRDAQRG